VKKNLSSSRRGRREVSGSFSDISVASVRCAAGDGAADDGDAILSIFNNRLF